MADNKKTTPEKEDKKQDQVMMSAEDAGLAHRIAQEDDSWQHIKEEDIHDFSLAEDPMKFPQECYEVFGEYAFRWVEKKKSRLDEIKSEDPPKRWYIVNKSQPPMPGPGGDSLLAKYCDPLHGGIQRLDQILVFKPRWMFNMHQAAKADITENQLKAGDIRNKGGVDDGTAAWIGNKEARVTGADIPRGTVGDEGIVAGSVAEIID